MIYFKLLKPDHSFVYAPYYKTLSERLSATEHSSTSHCIHVYMFLQKLLNVIVQIANKMGLQKKLMTHKM
jgi:hypothetical protein